MKREDIKLGIVVRFRNRAWSVVAIKEHIDGDIYTDLLTSGDYAKDISIEKLEIYSVINRRKDNTPKDESNKPDDETSLMTRRIGNGTLSIPFRTIEIEMFTESGEKVYSRIKKPTDQSKSFKCYNYVIGESGNTQKENKSDRIKRLVYENKDSEYYTLRDAERFRLRSYMRDVAVQVAGYGYEGVSIFCEEFRDLAEECVSHWVESKSMRYMNLDEISVSEAETDNLTKRQ